MLACSNIGPVDRAIRAIVGITALILAFTTFKVTEGAVPGVAAGIFGVIMLLTAALRMCPLYIPLKISTDRSAEPKP